MAAARFRMIDSPMNDAKLYDLISTLEKQIRVSHADVFEKVPIEAYISATQQYPKLTGYKYHSNEVQRYCAIIEGRSNQRVLETYHKLLLIRLIAENRQHLKWLTFPENVIHYYHEDFGRIISQIEDNHVPSGYYLYTNDRFFKDLAICCLRLFPVGARKFELSIFPVKRFLKNGWRQFTRLMLYLVFDTKGFAPFLTGHYDTDDPNFLSQFNVEGFLGAYRTIAEIMKMNAGIKGYFGINWLNDPQIERISPRLAYIRYMNIACGCRYYCLGPNESSIKNATMKSPTRKRLHQDGKYVPANYAFVYSRKQLIDWAEQYSWHW